MQSTKQLAFLMHPTRTTIATEGSRLARSHAGGCIKKAPAEAGASRIAAVLEGMGSHGSGRSGGLGFAGLGGWQIGEAVNLIEAEAHAFRGCKVNQLLGGFGGHGLTLLVVADICLCAADAITKSRLGDAEQFTDSFDLVHACILAALVDLVNSGAC